MMKTLLRLLLPMATYSYDRNSTPEVIAEQLLSDVRDGDIYVKNTRGGVPIYFDGVPSSDGFTAIAPAKVRRELCPMSIWSFKTQDGRTNTKIIVIPNPLMILLLVVYFGWFAYLGVMAMTDYFRFGVTEDLLVPAVMLSIGWIGLILGFRFLASIVGHKLNVIMNRID